MPDPSANDDPNWRPASLGVHIAVFGGCLLICAGLTYLVLWLCR